MRRFFVLVMFTCAALAQAPPRARIQGDCSLGGQKVTTGGLVSTTQVMRSFPSCTVTVYNTGTVTLSTIYSDDAGTPLANPFTADSTGHWFFYANNGNYDAVRSGAGFSSPSTIAGLPAVAPAQVLPYMNVVDGIKFTTIQAAINDLGSNSGTVYVPGGYAGPDPSTIPNGVTIWDARNQGRLIIRNNPTSQAAGVPGGLGVIVGPPTYSTANPAASGPVGLYASVLAQAWMTTGVWGLNVTAQGNSTTNNLTGAEVDVITTTGDNQGIGVDAVKGCLDCVGNAQAGSTDAAHRSLAQIGSAAWKDGLRLSGLSDNGIVWGAVGSNLYDTTLKATQIITGSGVAQTVTTNAVCTGTATFNGFFIGQWVTLDTGGSQEDVQLTNVVSASPPCAPGGTVNITGVFAKNHAINTIIHEYAGQKAWNGINAIFQTTPNYLWGSVKRYVDTGSPSSITFGVVDSAGATRVTEGFTSANQHVFRDLGGGWYFQSVGSVNKAIIDPNGTFSPATAGGTTLGTGALPFSGVLIGTAATNNTSIAGTVTAARALTLPDGNSTTVLPGALVTTAAASDVVTITGATAGSHCWFSPTDAAGATNIATTYISAKGANSVTISHAAIGNMHYDVFCTAN